MDPMYAAMNDGCFQAADLATAATLFGLRFGGGSRRSRWGRIGVVRRKRADWLGNREKKQSER